MTQAAIFIRNGVHPRRIVELYMGEPEPGSGELVARWGQKPPAPRGYIDTRPPSDGRPFREINSLSLNDGRKLPVWFAYVAYGPSVTLLYAIKHPSQKAQVKEMDQRAAKLLASRFPILRPEPTLVIAMPSQSWQAEHFAQEVATAAGLPLKTGVFAKEGAIKGTFHARKQEWARRSYRLLDYDGIEGQSIILADDNVGTGFSLAACAEKLYARGAAYVLGVATFRIAGAKDPEAKDVDLDFARAMRDLPAPGVGEKEEKQEGEQEDEGDLPHRFVPQRRLNARDRADMLKEFLTKADLSTMTFRDLVDLCETTDVEMRFALSQLGLANQIRLG